MSTDDRRRWRSCARQFERPPFVVERELAYERSFGEDAGARQIARQILVDLDLDGRFRVNGDIGRRLTILRQHPVSPRRWR